MNASIWRGLPAVVISRGLRGRSPLVKIVAHLGGPAPPKLFYQSCFSKRIDLASTVLYGTAMMNFFTTIWLLRSL